MNVSPFLMNFLKKKKKEKLFFTQRFACHQPFLFSLQAFFLLRRCCPYPLHEVTVCRSPLASTNRKQDFLLSFLPMDLYHRCCPSRPNSRQPLGDDYLTKTIDYPPCHPDHMQSYHVLWHSDMLNGAIFCIFPT